jgi:hypothetical protein
MIVVTKYVQWYPYLILRHILISSGSDSLVWTSDICENLE